MPRLPATDDPARIRFVLDVSPARIGAYQMQQLQVACDRHKAPAPDAADRSQVSLGGRYGGPAFERLQRSCPAARQTGQLP